MCCSLSLSLSLSLSYNNAQKFVGRDVLRERERERSLSKATVVHGMSAKHPYPHTPLQVSSSRPNFIRAGFSYKLITPERTSHYYCCVCVCGGGGGGVWWNISFEVHQCCYALPPAPPPPPPPFFFPFVSFLFLFFVLFCFFVLFFCLCSSPKSDDKCTLKLC